MTSIESDSIVGTILGTALGDALGLPYENLSRQRAIRLLGEPGQFRFLPDRGMVSDDTEHTCLAAQALIAAGTDPDQFSHELAWRMRWWFLSGSAGLGMATLRSTMKLWMGISPEHSGVFSAGNGPAMRSAILGAAISDADQLRKFVRISTRITHTDPKAEHAALAVAIAARCAAREKTLQSETFLQELQQFLPDTPDANELFSLLEQATDSASRGISSLEIAIKLGMKKGVSGYAYHTVPVSIHAALRHPRDFPAAVQGVIRCGGDADTTAAITGGIVGAAIGRAGLPKDWLNHLWEWPRTVGWMEQLGEQLAESIQLSTPQTPLRLPRVGLLARNLLFTGIVLIHGFRRLLPPY